MPPTESLPPVCAICLDRTRGVCRRIDLTHGVSVWLCAGHASPDYQRRHGGRDFAITLERVWQANGCLTASRRRALASHLRLLTHRPPRPKPGSHSWPELRRVVEGWFADGARLDEVNRRVAHRFRGAQARPPSIRTLARWRAERRWLSDATPPTAA